jgi:hypothetical protein
MSVALSVNALMVGSQAPQRRPAVLS